MKPLYQRYTVGEFLLHLPLIGQQETPKTSGTWFFTELLGLALSIQICIAQICKRIQESNTEITQDLDPEVQTHVTASFCCHIILEALRHQWVPQFLTWYTVRRGGLDWPLLNSHPHVLPLKTVCTREDSTFVWDLERMDEYSILISYCWAFPSGTA